MGWLNNFFGFFARDGTVKKVSRKELEAAVRRSGQRVQFMEFALQMCIDKIANALSLANYETYNKGKIQKGDIWYRFNYEPNQNQTQNEFLAALIGQMVKNSDGALVLMHNGEFILAESFEIDKKAFRQNVYKNITVAGGLQLNAVYQEEDVLHFTMNDSKVKGYLDDLYSEYGKLIGGAIRNYNRGNALKLGLNIGTLFDQKYGKAVVEVDDEGNETTEYDLIMDEMYEKRFAAVLSDEDSITPLEEGLGISSLVQTSANTKSGAVTTRDISDVIMDVVHYAADAFSIPRGIMKGDVADAEAIRDNFVNFGVRPWADAIETEINRKLYGKKHLAVGSKFKIQTNTILVYSAEKFASAGEALFRIGALSTNELRDKLGEEPIDEPWANQYFVSLNYARADGSGDNQKKGEVKASDKTHSV
ncbi:phage portal protein [Streptococcus suis]|uniref:phage portal protein n=1 Tax=Streptococcus suis TaxID=1307 RepID=UPI0005CCCD28|nr:phage portal protein [Streptococcus suis]MDW8625398.1 phage portal protein [Streptococcus suis]NQG47291.1 phage portal protein [Streptococcus suis]NQI06799.1 phage portal protein [Streptococcus suis]CYU26496.1 HK97 family phage portal protein [Streptococcus suis]CYW01508.1 HK97 family phage portal protein [Streptococcus suis]